MNESSSDIIIESDRGGLYVTLNQPDRGNGASDDMARRLTEVLLHAGERARFVVLRGSGEDFCTGRHNPKSPGGTANPEALARRRSSEVIFNCYQSFRACTVPIVSAVQGRAFGFGCSIAALSDITIASARATFQVPEMNHHILPTMVLSSLIDRVTRKDLAYLVYSREIVPAERARAMNIVSDVVPADRLDATVAALAATLAATPAAALEGVKEYLGAAYDMPIRGAVDFARNLHAVINSASEMRT